MQKLVKELIPEASPVNFIDLGTISKDLKIEPEEAFVNMVAVDVEAYAKVQPRQDWEYKDGQIGECVSLIGEI